MVIKDLQGATSARSSLTTRPTACRRSPPGRSSSLVAGTPPRPPLGCAVAELIPGARFEVMEEEAHEPTTETVGSCCLVVFIPVGPWRYM
jgi:hypothetical protein